MKNENLTLFIDLDGTVYDKKNGMWEEMSDRIDHFMRSELGIREEDVVKTRDAYYAQYGSSLRGLQIHHHVDTVKYLAYVHGMNLDHYLSPDPDLRYNLQSIPYKKWIFTNSDYNHALRVLKVLGLEDQFEGIFDVWSMHFIPKPDQWTYMNARALAGNPDPRYCVFVDDTIKNLTPAREMGWQTVWVDKALSYPSSSYTIPKLHYLPDVINHIESEVRLERIKHRGNHHSNIPVFNLE